MSQSELYFDPKIRSTRVYFLMTARPQPPEAAPVAVAVMFSYSRHFEVWRMPQDTEHEWPYRLRPALLEDCAILERLIAKSSRSIGVSRYTVAQIEGALRGAFGIDTQLIQDKTYFAVESLHGEIVGCGGWSRRRVLFGSDHRTDRETGDLNPATDAAKIRAFFVDPEHVRRGIASRILRWCESEATRSGFSRFELMSTLPGVPFYEALGYAAVEPVEYELEPNLRIRFVRMGKRMTEPRQIK